MRSRRAAAAAEPAAATVHVDVPGQRLLHDEPERLPRHRRVGAGERPATPTQRAVADDDVAQRLLDNTCQQRTGRHEDDGCWPVFDMA